MGQKRKKVGSKSDSKVKICFFYIAAYIMEKIDGPGR